MCPWPSFLLGEDSGLKETVFFPMASVSMCTLMTPHLYLQALPLLSFRSVFHVVY